MNENIIIGPSYKWKSFIKTFRLRLPCLQPLFVLVLMFNYIPLENYDNSAGLISTNLLYCLNEF